MKPYTKVLDRDELEALTELQSVTYQGFQLIDLVIKNYTERNLTNRQISKVLYDLNSDGKIEISENLCDTEFEFDRLILAHYEGLHRKAPLSERQRIGQRITELREEANMSAHQLAIEAKITDVNLARIEAGKYSTGQDILSNIAKALGKELNFI